MSSLETSYRSFNSTDHPLRAGKASVAAAALAKPIGFCMLPVMIAALVTMLQGFYALGYLLYGFPLASAVALGWTWLRVRSEIVEIHISNDLVAVRSLMEAASPASPLVFKRLIDVDFNERPARITLGLDQQQLHPGLWPEWNLVQQSLHSSNATGHQDEVRNEPSISFSHPTTTDTTLP